MNEHVTNALWVSKPALREFTFSVPGDPIAWARARLGFGRVYKDERQVKAQNAIGYVCREAMGGAEPIDGPVELTIHATFLRPKSHKKLGTPPTWKTSRSDLDNICKQVGDSLNKIAWFDDAQIAVLHAVKAWGDLAELRVHVRGL